MRDDQLKIIKYYHLIANLVICHNCHTITLALKALESEEMQLKPEVLVAFSPCRSHHLNHVGLFELKDREPAPVDYGIRF